MNTEKKLSLDYILDRCGTETFGESTIQQAIKELAAFRNELDGNEVASKATIDALRCENERLRNKLEQADKLLDGKLIEHAKGVIKAALRSPTAPAAEQEADETKRKNCYGETVDLSKPCPTCKGTGQVHSHNPRCWDCHGTGNLTLPSSPAPAASEPVKQDEKEKQQT